MNRRLPPLHALSAFEAVARHQSFARAADELFITASAVSHRVRQLEAFFDSQLFIRTARQVQLTQDGEVILDAVRQAIGVLNDVADMLCKHRNQRVIKVTVMPSLARLFLLPRLKHFRAAHPDIELEINASSQLVNLKAGEADIGLRYGRGQYEGLESIKLMGDKMYPACSPDYLAAHGPFNEPADLKRATLLRHSMERWKPWFELAGVPFSEPNYGPYFNDQALLLDAAADGYGVVLARHTLAQPLLRDGRLLRLMAHEIESPLSYFLVYPEGALARPELALFTTWLLAQRDAFLAEREVTQA